MSKPNSACDTCPLHPDKPFGCKVFEIAKSMAEKTDATVIIATEDDESVVVIKCSRKERSNGDCRSN